MADQPGSNIHRPNVAELSRNMVKIAAKSQQLVAEFLKRQALEGFVGTSDPLGVGRAFLEMTARMMSDPVKLVEAQTSLWLDYLKLWQSASRTMLGGAREPVIEPETGDRRFRYPAWDENLIFDFVKQSYLLTARWLQSTIRDVEGLDEKTAAKVDFYTRQFVAAMAPSNFVLTNPEVLRATFDSNGENLVRGLDNLLADLERGRGQLQIRMTDLEAFKVGENVGVSPGKVIYQNQLMQLIQFESGTETVYQRPLLIVPPWINKYYILDLRPDNSFIKWAVERGYTVFVVSWVNPDETLSEKSFEDYMNEGLLEALGAIEQGTAERDVTAIGYCVGGTLLAATLAHMKATGDGRIKAAAFFASLVDFAEAGEISVFIDEEQLNHLERCMEKQGYLEGRAMSNTFNMLRANDLIWSFVVNNYLLGKDPFPFDLLYWNSDSTNLPARMHSFYLRKMYQENLLSEPGGIELGGVRIDLTKIDIPVYILSAKEDHIAPWKSTFVATRLYSGPVKFVLAASGHIAGVVNPPRARKYSYWTNRSKRATPDAWLDGASEHRGSWWPDWHRWLSAKSGPKVPARVPGDGKIEPIEDAPGAYVKVRAD